MNVLQNKNKKNLGNKHTSSENFYSDFDVYTALGLQMVYSGPSFSHH